jgi:biopolymer transport protein ExbD
MQKRQKAVAEESISPNLIPMIDIMFLLLLFFMLSADMSQRQLEEVILPQASQVKEDPKTGTEGETTTTINIHHSTEKGVTCAVYSNGGVCREPSHWQWAIRGHDYTAATIKDQLQIEAQLHMETAMDVKAHKILSALRILIRADSGAPYGDVQKVIETCGTVGIYKVEVAAAKPAAEKK